MIAAGAAMALETPCLLLDRAVLARNLAAMAAVARRLGVALRPHMKTAKSIEVWRMAEGAGAAGCTVSTLAEAEYLAGHGVADMIYAAGIVPRKLDRVAALNAAGADVKLITDDPGTAAAIAAHPAGLRALVEVDSGEHRGGMEPDDARLLAVAAALGPRLAGVLTHAGHSYAGRSDAAMADIAEAERLALVGAAARLRAAGAPDDAVAELLPATRRLGIPRAARFRALGRVWRLGVLLLAADGSLRATGSVTRAVPPGHPGHMAASTEERREVRAAAFRSFPQGTTVWFDSPALDLAEPTGPLLVRDGRIAVRWSISAPDDAARDLGPYLDERVDLLLDGFSS